MHLQFHVISLTDKKNNLNNRKLSNILVKMWKFSEGGTSENRGATFWILGIPLIDSNFKLPELFCLEFPDAFFNSRRWFAVLNRSMPMQLWCYIANKWLIAAGLAGLMIYSEPKLCWYVWRGIINTNWPWSTFPWETIIIAKQKSSLFIFEKL